MKNKNTLANEQYNKRIIEIRKLLYLGDDSEAGPQYDTKIAMLRVYSEIIFKKLFCQMLNKNIKFENFGVIKTHLKKLKNSGYPGIDLILRSINETSEILNTAAHSSNGKTATKSDLDKSYIAVHNFIAFLFIVYFHNHTFGANGYVVTIFSTLPPYLRQTTLYELFNNDHSANYTTQLIADKLCNVFIKCNGIEYTKSWIEDNKELLEKIQLQNPSVGNNNLYDELIQKYIHGRPNLKMPFSYEDFESAKMFYEKLKDLYIEQATKESDKNISLELNKFIDLMDFIYIGIREDVKAFNIWLGCQK